MWAVSKWGRTTKIFYRDSFSAAAFWWCRAQVKKDNILHRELCQPQSEITVPRPLSRRKNWREKKNEDQCFQQRTRCRDWLPARLDLEQSITKRKKLSSGQQEDKACQWALFFWLIYLSWKLFQIGKENLFEGLKVRKQMNLTLDTAINNI